jgi:class 3 adenylate cyclase
MGTGDVRRRLAAIMSADVKGYSRLMAQDEAGTVRTLTSYQETMTTLIDQHHGRIVDSPGDNVLAEFASVVDAVQGAVAIQRELRARNTDLPDDRKMEFRIGINLGDIIVEGERIYGDGVNIAARLERLADPGGICISRTAYDQIEDKLPFGYEYLGERRVKNIAKPVRAYKVLVEPEDASHAKRREGPGWRKDRQRDFGRITIERPADRRPLSKPSFSGHLRAYAGIIGFLLILDLLTGGGFWFYWPALFWGLFLLIRWSRDFVHSSTRTTKADQETPVARARHRPSGERLKHLSVRIEPKADETDQKERVHIRVPVRILRAGAKLSSILPRHARDRINEALRAHDVGFDLSSLDGDELDSILELLAETGIDIERDDKRIRIFCE